MTLTPGELEDFKVRYEHAFNIRLSDGEALDLADRLEELYRIVLDRSAGAEDVPRHPIKPWWRRPRGEGEGRGPPA
jgi:hypothetical protein